MDGNVQPIRTLVILLSFHSLWAQTAALRGRITDSSGAVVPSAVVTLNGASGGAAQSAVADSVGVYSFQNLTAGEYTLSASAPDLALPAPEHIVLKPGSQIVDLQLIVTAKLQQVTVHENGGPSVSTDSSNNASAVVLRGQDLDALSDDPDDLAADLQALAGPAAGPSGGSIFVDGFSGADLPPKESIREIRINQNPFSAEYDKLGYGRIEIFTKPGSDKYHATLPYNFADQVWNSRNPYAPRKAPFMLNEFEPSGGGPLGHRASFTLDFQHNAVDNASITNAVTVDPQSYAVTPFSSFVSAIQRLTRVSPRIDYALTPNNTLTVRYNVTHATIQDAGIGAFDLTSRGYHTSYTVQTVQAAETAVIGQVVNETRFQYYRNAFGTTANTISPEVQVLGAFNGGGASASHSPDVQNNFELQNYTSGAHGAHAWKFGVRLRRSGDDNLSAQDFNGTFTFGGGDLEPVLNAANQEVLDASGSPLLAPITSIERYRRTLVFEQLGYSPAQISALGGGATLFSINAGTPELTVRQVDAGLFAGDDWRVRPNLTLSVGLRWEGQSNIHDWRDWAPRVAVAWAPGGGRPGSHPKTVLRAGFGMFYDRFPLSGTLAAERYNGVVQQQYVVTNPDFYPIVPAIAAPGASASTQAIQEISSNMRAPYLMQSAFTVERQLPANTTLAVTYTNSHGVHELISNDINAPVNGGYPLGKSGPVFLMESAGLYNQNQLITNVNSKVNSAISVFGFYVLNRAMSNTDGLGTSPANPYNFAGEYGPAFTDVRHRVTLGGSLAMRWNIRISPYLVLQSGAPFNITSGNDLFGTTLYNSRPGFATASTPGAILTSYGWLDPAAAPGEAIVPRNYGRGPGQESVNLRIGKAIGFGRPKGEKAARDPGMPAASAPLGGVVNNGSLRGLLGAPTSERRFTLTISMSIRNLLNHTNAGPISGNITSPLFGFANQVAGTPNGEGFFETANNRRLELQMRLAF